MLFAVLMLLCFVGFAHATTIDDLFNTGVDGTGSLLGDNLDDPHYAIISQPDPGGLSDWTVTGYPIPPWAANDANSRWIGLNTNRAVGPPGDYIYETTFTVGQDADLSTVEISGLWGTDNSGTIWLNGNDTGVSGAGFTSLYSFSLTSGFQLGTNSLQFRIVNAGDTPNPSGLRVDDMVGTYSTVPEPATMILLGFGLLGLAGIGRKKQ